MAIRRNYFFENITEEDPTKAVVDPNLLDYDKTDSYSQTTPVGDEGVAGTVDTDLGDGKEEEIKGDGTPTLEQLLIEEAMIEEMAEMVLEAKIENEEDFKRALKEIDGKPGAIMKAIGIYYGFFSKIYGVTSFMKTGKVNPQLVVVSIIGTPLTTAMVGFIAKQTADKQVKLRAYRRLEKKISKTISKLEKQKDKEGVDVKALDKKIKDLKKSQSIVEKKISETEKIKDEYTRESASALDFDTYMESIFAGIEDSSEPVVESEVEAPEPQATVFEAFYGDDYINNVIAVAMNESYAQDLALMNYIASIHESMQAIREADEETKSQVSEAKKKSLKERIAGIIKAFTEGVKKVFDKIVEFFQNRAKDFNKFVDKFKTKLGKHGDEEVEGDEIIGSFEAKFEKDINPDDLDDIPEVDATVVEHLLMLAEKNDMVPVSQAGADGKSKRMRYRIKDLLQHFSALLNKIPVLGRFKKFVYGKIKNIQRKIDTKIANLDDESKIRKIMNGFTEWKKKCMGAIHKASETLKKAWGAVTGAIKAAIGKIFKKGEKDKQEKEGETKNEMALYVSEAALGELIYSEYMAEEAGECGEKDDCKAGDVAQVADGVDVTDVIDGVIEKDETVTKEKTVSINNESYRVKVSATRL